MKRFQEFKQHCMLASLGVNLPFFTKQSNSSPPDTCSSTRYLRVRGGEKGRERSEWWNEKKTGKGSRKKKPLIHTEKNDFTCRYRNRFLFSPHSYLKEPYRKEDSETLTSEVCRNWSNVGKRVALQSLYTDKTPKIYLFFKFCHL